jgi:hypothetical protein
VLKFVRGAVLSQETEAGGVVQARGLGWSCDGHVIGYAPRYFFLDETTALITNKVRAERHATPKSIHNSHRGGFIPTIH